MYVCILLKKNLASDRISTLQYKSSEFTITFIDICFTQETRPAPKLFFNSNLKYLNLVVVKYAIKTQCIEWDPFVLVILRPPL